MYAVCDEIRDSLATAMSAQLNKVFVGKLREPAINEMPIACIYGVQTDITSQGTVHDLWTQTVNIEVFISAYNYIDSTAEDSDKTLQVQKKLYDLMEEIDSNNVPKSTTVLGTLRRNITGSKFTFHNDYSIAYEDGLVDDKVFWKATLTCTVTSLNERS